MSIDFLLMANIAAISVFGLVLRTNIAIAILALGMGYLLADLTTQSIVGMLVALGVSAENWPLNSIVAIILTISPSLLILIRFRRFQPGRWLEHLPPAVFLGLLMTLLVLYQLPFEIKQQLEDESYVFNQLQYFRTAIVIGAAIIAIFDVMVHEKKLKKRAKRGKGGSDN